MIKSIVEKTGFSQNLNGFLLNANETSDPLTYDNIETISADINFVEKLISGDLALTDKQGAELPPYQAKEKFYSILSQRDLSERGVSLHHKYDGFPYPIKVVANGSDTTEKNILFFELEP